LGIAENDERDIFVSALQLKSAAEREAYLKEVCASRPELLDRVRSLLQANTIEDGFLETPLLEAVVAVGDAGLTEAPGAVIGRYKLLERIGEGGMAVVYMAGQERPVQRKVALKIIKLGMDTKSVIARFEAERQALALMDHPGIAKVFDGGATETGRPYFVMELVRGVPITEYCDQNQLSTRARLDLFIQVCQAIQHAHQKGIIHRDIKPSNILVTLHDGTPVPKVIDFGIAKATESRLTDRTLFTRFQTFVGTPAYMSPEQAQMSGLDIDTRADIYALGVLLYELLTGRTPFESQELLRTGLEDCRRMIREKEPTRPSTRVSTLPHEELTTTAERRRTEPAQLIRLLRTDLDWITMKCLEKDRTRRYETASALVLDIRRHLDGQTVWARPPSTKYRVQKFVRRNKVIVAVASVVVLAAIVSTWQAIRATRAEREQSRLRGTIQEALQQEAQQRQRAEAQELAALRRAYNSDMTLAQQALGVNNYGRVVGLLDRYRPKPQGADFRQWEWRYFWNQTRSEAAFALPQQPDAITGVALSPDSRLLVSTDMSGRLKLWDLGKRTELMALHEPGLDVRVFAFSHDGARLVTVINEGRRPATVRVWTVAERKMAIEFPCAGRVCALAFSPDDTGLLLLGQDLSVHNWDFQEQHLERVLPALPAPRRGIGLVAFSPDRQRIAFLEGERIHVLDLTTGSEIAVLEAFQGGTWSLAFSPDGKLLAAGPSSAETSTEIKLFSLASGQELRRLVGHVSWVPALTFTPDGRQLVSAGADQTVRIWDVAQGREQVALHGHLSEIYRVAVSSDGNTIVSGCKDGTILVWDAKRIERRSRFETLPIPVADLVFLSDSREMLSVNLNGTVTLWDTKALQEKESLGALGREVKHLLVSSDGTRVFAGTRRGEVIVLDWPTRHVITTLKEDSGHGGPLEPVGLIDRDRTLVATVAGSTVHLLDTASWQIQAQWQIEGAGAWARQRPHTSADGTLLAAGELRGPLHFLSLPTGQAWTIEAIQPWGASDLAFSPDGRLLATSSLEGIIRLWDSSSHAVVDVLRGHLIGVNVVVFSPDGQRLASGSQGDEAVKLWDMPTRQEVATLPGEGLISGDLAFSPDATLLVGINAQGKAHIWRAPSLDEVAAAERQSDLGPPAPQAAAPAP
jgi:WD40 repeat protein/serine/threonine protein kinase